MEVKNCKTCGKQFLSETDNSYCRICNKKWYEKQEKIREQAENLKWQEQKEQERKLFEAKVQTYKPILMESVNPSAHTLYIIGNGFDLMHRVPSSYYNFRDSLGKNNSLRYSLETALTAEDIWADFENALGTLNLNLMGSRNIIDMWLDDFGVYGDEDSGAAEFYMAVEAAAAPMANLVNNLQPTFRRWIERLEVGTDDRPLNGLIHPQGKVLDFNYTEFIETLYGVKEVCYIHGSRKKKKKLILGHKPGAAGNFHQKNRKPQNYRQAMIDVAQDNVFDLIGQYDKDLTKDSQEIIKNNQAFFDGLACTEQIVVIGHSISLVDWDYFIEVNKKASNAHWCFGIYGLNDLRNMAELVKSLNIKNYDIFRTDSIWTKPKKVGNGKASQRALKPRIFQEDEITVTIRQMYDLMIADSYEIILPNHAKSIVIYAQSISKFSPFMLVIAFALFCMCINRRPSYSKSIGFLSRAVLPVYLIHESDYISSILWDYIFKIEEIYSKSYFAILFLGIAVLIFSICVMVDFAIRPIYGFAANKVAEYTMLIKGNIKWKNQIIK